MQGKNPIALPEVELSLSQGLKVIQRQVTYQYFD
jgi:hypothetical protein